MSSDTPIISPYGSWKSPLSAASVASASNSVGSVLIDQATTPSRVYWLESRPSEGGRRTLLSKLVDDYSDATLIEHLPDPKWNVRTAVHEYGGGAYAVHNGVIVFANWSDQGVYVLDTRLDDKSPRRIGAKDDKLRYASFAIHRSGGFVVCVREDHRNPGTEALAGLVAVALDKDEEAKEVVLYEGADFVSSPAMSQSDEIAFFTWNHPDMNWDATTLWRARLHIPSGLATGLDQLAVVAGCDSRESIYQPRFDSDGTLHFISDRIDGFWNPYHVDSTGAVCLSLAQPMAVEFAAPEWCFGQSTMQPVPGRRAAVAVTYGDSEGNAVLGILDTVAHEIEVLPTPGWSSIGELQLGTSRSGEPVLVLVAGGPTEPESLFTYYINGIGAARLTAASAAADSMAGYVS
ncbi:Esterase lipase thioesterase active site, partial [Coemansia aciculifera]